MSVRKISELPYLDVYTSADTRQLDNSIMEISWSKYADPTSAYWFESKYFRYGEMVSSVIERITGTPNKSVSVDFYTYANFHHPVNFYAPISVYNSLELSGNFYVNKNVLHDDITTYGYEILLRAYNNTISSLNDVSVIADNDVYIIGKNMTKLGLGPWIVINEKVPDISVNAPINIMSSMYVTGKAKFTQDIDGTAMHARWSDLAEGYRSDAKYEPGTFVMFGGEKEITIAVGEANAVITTKPGFVLGSGDRDESFQDIVLVGRTPVKVIGNVQKFDKLVMSDIPGVAKTQTDVSQKVIARALADSPENHNGDIHLVEAVLRLDL